MIPNINRTLVISYREQNDSSVFLDVNQLLESKDLPKIFSVYERILCDIQAFEKNKINMLKQLNERFFKRLLFLNSNSDQKTGIWQKLGITQFLKRRKQAQIQAVYTAFCSYLSLIEKSLLPKLHARPLVKIETLKKSRVADPEKELQRLKKNKRIKRSLKRISKFNCNPDKTHYDTEQLVAFAHSLELREALKATHFVLNHGQNLEFIVVNLFAKKLKQLFEPKQYENFEILRHEVHVTRYSQSVHTVDWFRERLKKRFESDETYTKELIAADCFLESTDPDESALDFFSGTPNIANGSFFLKSILQPIVQTYFPDPITQSRLIHDLLQVTWSLPAGGTLYSICIPKEKFHSVAYLSAAFGKPYPKKFFTIQDLERFQDGSIFTESENEMVLNGMGDLMKPQNFSIFISKVMEGYKPHEVQEEFPQVRILAHKLQPEEGIFIFANSTLDEEELQNLGSTIDLLIQKATIQFRV